MKVVANRRGFDGLRIREPGDVFDMPDDTVLPKARVGTDGQFLAPWFEPVDKATAHEGADQ